ncbi:hypothetical protein DSO57_1032350 [Entomophthora muscae]|uniref:Uncharacterized protein n=1 Tax=Entomophthora muscae TaxID=34485 RepID=A0ACC2TBH1_9FUNG|nr:hypothetical protein DSO57_1032350 [Entomophthora muscae]
MKFLCIFSLVAAHMEMMNPVIPKSQFDESLAWFKKDYTNVFPVGNQYYQDLPFCHHSLERVSVNEVEAGGTLMTEFAGEADHEGGHCEFSLSYGGDDFVVIHTIIADCLANGVRSYEIEIPESAPAGTATLSWTWYNKIGEREMYMNCAKLKISGPARGAIRGPARVLANLPGLPVIHQFKFSVKGIYLYRNRPSIETGIDEDGQGYSRQITPVPAPRNLPGRSYFYDPYNPTLDPTEGLPSYSKDENIDD